MKKRLLSSASIAALSFYAYSAASAADLPQGGSVVGGSASLSYSSQQLDINQSTTNAVINWNSFGVGVNNVVNFAVPSGGATHNHVVGASASQILGQINSNGAVFISNPNGIYFGSGAHIDVAGLVATTSQIDTQAFMSGQRLFNRDANSNGSVINEGTITIKGGGLAALVAPQVENRGIIVARLGTVQLASADSFEVVDVFGNGIINFSISDSSIAQKVTHSGVINADGGYVAITANDLGSVLDSVINMDGIIRADTVGQQAGKVVIGSSQTGLTRVTGTINADGGDVNSDGGAIEILGHQAGVFNQASLSANGNGTGDGGTINVGGSRRGEGPLPNSQDIFVSADASVNADGGINGDGGTVILYADQVANLYGNITARGGSISGDGGFIETSGKKSLNTSGVPDVSRTNGAAGEWLSDPRFLNIVTTGTESAGGIAGNDGFTDNSGNTSTLLVSTIATALGNGNVTLQATNEISINADISFAGSNTLTFESAISIALRRDVTATGTGNITFISGSSGGTAPSTSQASNFSLGASTTFQNNSTVTTNGGNLDLNADLTSTASFAVSGTSDLGGNVTTGGTTTFTGATTFSGGTARTVTTSDDNVTFSSTIDGGGQNLTIAAGTGTVQFDGAASSITDFDSTGSGNFDLNADLTTTGTVAVTGTSDLGGDVTAGGVTTFTGATTLSGGARTITTSNDNVIFGATVNGGSQNLTVAAGTGTVQFDGAASSITDFASTGSGNLDLNADLTTTGTVAVTGTSDLGGNVTTGGAVTFTGATTLSGGARTITTTNDNVTFSSTINGGQNLTVDTGGTTGTVQLDGIVGGTTAVSNVDITGNLDLNADLTATGGLTVSGTADLGGDVTAGGAVTFTGATTLSGGARTITASDAIVTFSDTLDGGNQNLTIAAGTGTVQFDGVVSSITDFDSTGSGNLDLNANLTTTGTVAVTGTSDLGADLAAGGAVTFTGATTLSGGARTITASDAIVTFSSTLDGGSQDLTIAAGTAKVQFNRRATKIGTFTSTGSGNLDLNADLTTTGTVAVTGTSDLGGNVTTGGAVTFTGATTLSGGARTITTTNDNVTFSSTINGGQNLTVDTGGTTGTVQLDGIVGGTTAVSNVDITGNLDLNADLTATGGLTVSGTADLGGDVTAGGAVTFTGATTLSGGARTVTTSDDNVTFSSTIDGGGQNLTIAAGTGTVQFDGAASSITDFDSTGSGNFDLNADLTTTGTVAVTGTSDLGGDVTAGGVTTFTGATTLSGGARTITTSNDNVIFGATVNGGSQNLTVAAGTGTVQFDGAASSITDFASTGSGNLDLNADLTTTGTVAVTGTSDLGGNVTTGGAVTFTGATTLSGGARTITTTNDNVTFSSTINGGQNLTVDTGGTTGTVQLDGIVGGTTAVSNVDITGNLDLNADLTATGGLTVSGTADLGGDVTAGGAVTFTGATTLSGGARTITASDAIVTFSDTLDGGNQNLTIAAGTGTVQFDGVVSSITDFDSTGSGNLDLNANLTTTGTVAVTGTSDLGADLAAGGAVTFTGATTLSGGARTITASDAIVTFSSTLDGGSQDLTIAAGTAKVQFNRRATKIGTFTSTGGGDIDISNNTKANISGNNEDSFSATGFVLPTASNGTINITSPTGNFNLGSISIAASTTAERTLTVNRRATSTDTFAPVALGRYNTTTATAAATTINAVSPDITNGSAIVDADIASATAVSGGASTLPTGLLASTPAISTVSTTTAGTTNFSVGLNAASLSTLPINNLFQVGTTASGIITVAPAPAPAPAAAAATGGVTGGGTGGGGSAGSNQTVGSSTFDAGSQVIDNSNRSNAGNLGVGSPSNSVSSQGNFVADRISPSSTPVPAPAVTSTPAPAPAAAATSTAATSTAAVDSNDQGDQQQQSGEFSDEQLVSGNGDISLQVAGDNQDVGVDSNSGGRTNISNRVRDYVNGLLASLNL